MLNAPHKCIAPAHKCNLLILSESSGVFLLNEHGVAEEYLLYPHLCIFGMLWSVLRVRLILCPLNMAGDGLLSCDGSVPGGYRGDYSLVHGPQYGPVHEGDVLAWTLRDHGFLGSLDSQTMS